MEKFEFFIAGVKFHQAKSVINEMQVDDELDMEQEPENKFDPNAIKLLYNGIMLGYVPAKMSGSVSAFLEYAEDPRCLITYVNPKAKTYEQIKCEIFEAFNEDDYEDDQGDEIGEDYDEEA